MKKITTGNKTARIKFTKRKKISNNADGSLCSGYKIFPDDSKCLGCIDCEFGKLNKTVEQVFNDSHSMITIEIA